MSPLGQPLLDQAPTVTAYMSADHDRLGTLLDEVAAMARDGELERADDGFREWRDAMLRHIRLEEEILFPVCEERTAEGAHPCAVMRREHVFIRACIAMAAQALDRGDRGAFLRGHEELDERLDAHDMKEERVLYPMIDAAIQPAELADIVERLRAAR